MSDQPAKLPPKRTKSGENPAVRTFRDKLESIQEGTYGALEELNRQAAELKAKSDTPPAPKDEDEPTDVEPDLEAPTPKKDPQS